MDLFTDPESRRALNAVGDLKRVSLNYEMRRPVVGTTFTSRHQPIRPVGLMQARYFSTKITQTESDFKKKSAKFFDFIEKAE